MSVKEKKRDPFDVAREEASIKMFTSADTWPGLILPVKNYDLKKDNDPFGLLGVLANPASETVPLIIYETNLWAPDFKNSKKHIYESVMDAIEAGWVVD
jgi:hypothetical protein